MPFMHLKHITGAIGGFAGVPQHNDQVLMQLTQAGISNPNQAQVDKATRCIQQSQAGELDLGVLQGGGMLLMGVD